MTGRETAGEDDGSIHVIRSRDGGLVLRLSELPWETAFFGKKFGRLAVDIEGIQDFDVDGLHEPLQEVLSFSDGNGFDLVEFELDVSWVHHSSLFEDRGFRLVDTKLRFLTLKKKEELRNLPPPVRETCLVSEDMKAEILALTHRAFTSNPSFKSRFNNETYFSRSETERYYAAWIEHYMGDRRALFAVVRDEGRIVGYLIYTKKGEHQGKPLYKAALMAVDPEYHGKKVCFDLRSFVFALFPESEVYLDTTTQLSNLSAIRNLIRTQKTLESIRLCFYRRGPGKFEKPHAEDSQDNRFSLGLSEMEWETEFFGRRYGRLEVNTDSAHGVEANALDQALKNTLPSGDQNGFNVIEVQLDMSWLHHMHLFESNGFRLVDTKIRFITSREKMEINKVPEAKGELGFASKDMKEEILALTRRAFAENPSFKSRFNNSRYFSRSDTERYYAAWIENYIGDENTLFGVMKDEGRIVGYLIYAKIGEHEGKPLYKGALTAVAPEHRGKKINLALRSFIYKHLPKAQICLDQTTQLTNLSMIRSLIRAKSNLESIELIFYRKALHRPL